MENGIEIGKQKIVHFPFSVFHTNFYFPTTIFFSLLFPNNHLFSVPVYSLSMAINQKTPSEGQRRFLRLLYVAQPYWQVESGFSQGLLASPPTLAPVASTQK